MEDNKKKKLIKPENKDSSKDKKYIIEDRKQKPKDTKSKLIK